MSPNIRADLTRPRHRRTTYGWANGYKDDGAGVVDTVTRQGHDGPLADLDVKVVKLEVGAVSEDDLLDAGPPAGDTARQHTRAELAGDWPVLETARDPEDPDSPAGR
jgi:hypothetical protein